MERSQFLNEDACQSLKRNTLTPLSFLLLQLPPSQSSISSAFGLEKAFRCAQPSKTDWLQTQGRDVRNVRFLQRGVGGGEGKEWRRKTRLPKTRHGRGAKLWRFEGGGSGSAAPAPAGPQNVAFLRSRPVNHCLFTHHAVPSSPLLPVLQPAQAPSCTF